MLSTPIFVHCHECGIRTNPSGTMVLDRWMPISMPRDAMDRLCVTFQSMRGAEELFIHRSPETR